MSATDLLRALMEADRWIERVNAQRTHLPESAELAALEVELRGLMKALQGAEARARLRSRAPTTTPRATPSGCARGRVISTRPCLRRRRTRENCNALQTELTHVRELLDASEDRELELLMALEPLKREIDD